MGTITGADAKSVCAALRARLGLVVAAHAEAAELLVIGLLAGGHALIECVPGIGKTLLARTLARAVACAFHRIQFTNDLLPSDVVGTTVYKPDTGKFVFVRGPLFADIVLADEINRTSPRTLSCLLEAMETGTVSIEGKGFRLGDPFLVLATRNPIEFHGTQPMPEAALDRFMMRIELGYPDRDSEIALYEGSAPEERLMGLEPVVQKEQLLELCAQVRTVAVSRAIAGYCLALTQATRQHPDVVLGASPRAALSLLQASRARALADGRDYVLPDDLKALCVAVLGHRVVARDRAQAPAILAEITARTPVSL